MPMLTPRAGRRPMVRLACVAAAVAALTAGCASQGAGDRTAQDASYGYRWVGAGEPGDFATAAGFCRQTLQAENFGALPTWDQRGSNMVSYNMPDTGIAGASYRPGYAQRRDFDGCMKSQGWEGTVIPPGAAPGAKPAPSSSPPPQPVAPTSQ